MKNLARILTVAIVTAFIAIACEQQAVEPARGLNHTDLSSKEGSSARLSLLDDCTCCGDGSDTPTYSSTGPSSGGYNNWTAHQYNFCDTGSPQIQFEGQFNSFVRGINGWNVDYIDIGTASDNDWCEIISTINAGIDGGYEHDLTGSLPSPDSCNVMGINDPLNAFGGAAYGVGWYTYNTSTTPRSIQSIRDLIVWKNCEFEGTFDPCAVNSICSATIAYRLKINSITPVPVYSGATLTHWTSQISFEWECISIEECDECD